jgi:hypothetical protein
MHDDEETAPEGSGKAEEHPTIEEHAAKLKTPGWALAFAKVFHRWGEGHRMSEADFVKNVNAANSHPVG